MTQILTSDSRQYRFGYRIHSPSEVPRDFPPLPPPGEWLAAIFIPGDTEAFWQPPEYPPRIYLLERNSLAIYSHPASCETPFEVPLRDLAGVELQKSLLYGTIEFHTDSASRCFRYSTVHQQVLNPFLRILRRRWLSPREICLRALSVPGAHRASTMRCLHALQMELDSGELLYGLCCQPAIQIKSRTWLFPRSRTTPAILLAATSKRVIAISTGTGEINDPFELVIRYATPSGLAAVEAQESRAGFSLNISIRSGCIWKFLFSNGQIGAVSSFLAVLERMAPIASQNMPAT
jgi:hypothetical protein